jgi:hypothetical protein
MSDNYFSRTELLNRVTGFISDLALMGVALKSVCFCESTADEVVQQAEYEGQHRCEKPSTRVKHILTHGTINGVKITSSGDEQ